MTQLELSVAYGTRAEKIRMVRHKVAVARSVRTAYAYGRRAIAAMYLADAATIRRSIV